MFIMIDNIASRVFDPKLCKKLICNKPFLMAASLLQRQKSTPCDICHYAVKMLDMRFKYFNELVQRTLSELDQICGYIAYKELSSQVSRFQSQQWVSGFWPGPNLFENRPFSCLLATLQKYLLHFSAKGSLDHLPIREKGLRRARPIPTALVTVGHPGNPRQFSETSKLH